VGRYAHEFQRKGQLILRPEYFGCLSRILIYRKPQKDKTQPCGCPKRTKATLRLPERTKATLRLPLAVRCY
jgi:hypothetical protein